MNAGLPTLKPGDVALYLATVGGRAQVWAVQIERVFVAVRGNVAIEATHARPGTNFPRIVADRRQFLSLESFSGRSPECGTNTMPAGADAED